jgi:hypothetical protein
MNAMPDLIDQPLGRCHILEELGDPGMAVVYRVYDTRLERNIAVKDIRRGAFPPKPPDHILKRFEREAMVLLTQANQLDRDYFNISALFEQARAEKSKAEQVPNPVNRPGRLLFWMRSGRIGNRMICPSKQWEEE